ncbi:MAG TPA: hypothetical protein VIW73_07355 [Candidatus Cybelea sp.]
MTLSIGGTPDERHREAIDEAVRAQGGRTTWRVHPKIGRSYALIESAVPFDVQAIRAVSGGEAYESAVIALAVSPAVPQALPSLQDALGGPGRPAGVLACHPFPGGAVIEWDPDVSGAEVVMGLIDVELRRFASGRTVEVLAPLPKSTVAQVAAEGLQAPEIRLDRVLEALVDDA